MIVLGDWGSSRLRLWSLAQGLVTPAGDGPGVLSGTSPAQALRTALGGRQPERIVLCGMAGSREGLFPAGYAPCPGGRDDWREAAAHGDLDGIPVTIAAGFSARSADGRPDVMRGEECLIFGAMAKDQTLARGRHLLLLPGTHSKWVRIDEGRIIALHTWMTGEIYARLAGSSLAYAAPDANDGADHHAGFDAGLARSLRASDALACLFEARAAQLIDGRSAAWSGGFVSGLLIGSELAQMLVSPPAGPVIVIADAALGQRYGAALEARQIAHDLRPAEPCAIAGLRMLADA